MIRSLRSHLATVIGIAGGVLLWTAYRIAADD